MNKRLTFTSFYQNLREFGRNTRGVSAVIIAFLAIPLFGFVGLSVDLGRAYVLKSKLSTAVDAAGLAAGRNIFADDAEIYADAQKYFDANFPSGYMGTSPITMDATTLNWDATREKITLNVRADMTTTFMNVLKQPELTVGATTEITRSNRGLELIMVLDNTGSMARDSGTDSYTGVEATMRIEDLRRSAKKLTEILYSNEETQDNLWVGLVPYVTQVNVGYDNIAFLKSTERSNIKNSSSSIFKDDTTHHKSIASGGTSYGWKGCVELRGNLDGGTTDVTDNPPSNDFAPYFYTSNTYDNDWIGNGITHQTFGQYDVNDFFDSVGEGPNAGCPSPILPLTAERSVVDAAIDDMRPWYSGGTMGNVGMVWGWRAISPRWRGLWSESSTYNLPTGYTALPIDYNDPLIDKVVIMMTDGQNLIFSHQSSTDGYDYNSYGSKDVAATGVATTKHNEYGRLKGYSSSVRAGYEDDVDGKFAQLCTSMKSAGITIYTIKFKAGNDSLYRNCATSTKHYYDSPSADDLEAAFTSIGQELSNLRISK
ncbi:MAG: TadE/TadG family type IV pilus assembly protein [Sneathiella sp.]